MFKKEGVGGGIVGIMMGVVCEIVVGCREMFWGCNIEFFIELF